MPKTIIRILVPLIGSEVLGVLAADRFFRLFLQTVPPAVLTSFNRGTAHAAFIVYGILLGLVIFGWSLAVVGMSRVGKGRAEDRPAEDRASR